MHEGGHQIVVPHQVGDELDIGNGVGVVGQPVVDKESS